MEIETKAKDCEVCKVKLARHPRCAACGALAGDGHGVTDLLPYRGHRVCEGSIKRWNTLDKLAGRITTWKEMIKGKKDKDEQER